MSDSRVGGYPMGVTDAAIERHFGGACEPRMCGNCRHFCSSDIHVDYGYCHLEFERAYDAEAPDRKEGFWRGEATEGFDSDSLLEVADLIDRPTCHLVEDEDGRTACSECGCTALYLLDATYCPDCGSIIERPR